MISLKNKVHKDYDLESLYKDKERLDKNIDNKLSYQLNNEYDTLLSIQTLLIEDFTMSITIVNEMLNKIKVEIEKRDEQKIEELHEKLYKEGN